jgi:acetylornithine/succinyldiaminopimelate/putrescine aminotransferase
MLEVDRAEGVFIYDTHSKRYFDFISGISVSNVGHRHPYVVAAIQDQLHRYLHVMVYGEFIQNPQVKLATKLAGLLPDPLDSVYFVNSGSEAVDGALKLAKRITNRSEIISFTNAYHGSSHGALSVMGNEFFKQSYRPLLPDIRSIPFNKEDELAHITEKTACVIAETFQGEAGAVLPEFEWLVNLRKRCTEVGALLILDEIQTGFGRTGTMFAFEQANIIPDILLIAKGMGGGLPIGAFISSREHMQHLTSNPVLGHITTFGGNALCCAASLATIEVIIAEKLIEQVHEKEQMIRSLLVHPEILEIRGKGLLLAAEFGSVERSLAVMQACFERGLITDWFLFADTCLRISPPLTITIEELREACDLFLRAVQESSAN